MAGVVALRSRPADLDEEPFADPLGEESAVLAEVRPLRTLAEIRAAGLVRHASEHAELDTVERSLPVALELRDLIPGGHLRRGATVAVASGSTSLLYALLATASAVGSWCSVVGMPHLGLVAAAEAGVAVDRFALVPNPGPQWTSVVAALLDGVDIVVAAPPGPVVAQVATRLTARARQRGAVLVPIGEWPGADLTLEVVGGEWHGLGRGQGRLQRHEVEVVAYGRGAATRTRRTRLILPAPTPIDLEHIHVSKSLSTWIGPRSTSGGRDDAFGEVA